MTILTTPKPIIQKLTGSYFSFNIYYGEIEELIIRKDGVILNNAIDVTLTPRHTQPNGIYFFYDIVDVQFTVPLNENIIEIVSLPQLTQIINFSAFDVISKPQLEYNFDKITVILQYFYTLILNLKSLALPSPVSQPDGRPVVTDGSDGFTLFPYSIQEPVDTDDGKLLEVDASTKSIKFVDYPTLPNLPTPTQELRYVTTESGAFDLSPIHPLPTASDIGSVEILDSADEWKFTTATGLLNPPIPTPTAADENKILSVDSSNKYTLSDPAVSEIDSTARTWLNNGVIKGCSATYSAGSTSITIAPGEILFCTTPQAGQPDVVKVLTYAGETYTLKNTTTQQRTYIYIDDQGVISENATLQRTVKGSSVLLFEVDHSGKTSIEGVYTLFYDLNALPEQIRLIFEAYGNQTHDLILSATGTNVLSHTGGSFYGYNVGVNTNQLSPHHVLLPPKTSILFHFRTTDGTDGVNHSTFPAIPYVEKTSGVLTALPTGEIGYYPVWLKQNNTLVIQYSNTSWAAGLEPSVPDYLFRFSREQDISFTGVLLGLVKWQEGEDFSTTNTFETLTKVAANVESADIIPGTPADKDKIITIDAAGKNVLGVVIQQEPDSGDTLQNKFLAWDSTGTKIIPKDVSIPAIGTFPTGSYLLCVRNGVFEALTNLSDYVDPCIWAMDGKEYYLAEPYGVSMGNKGIMCSKGTNNNLNLANQLRFSDFIDTFTNMTFVASQMATIPPNIFATNQIWQPGGDLDTSKGQDQHVQPIAHRANPRFIPVEGEMLQINTPGNVGYSSFVSDPSDYVMLQDSTTRVSASNTTTNPIKFKLGRTDANDPNFIQGPYYVPLQNPVDIHVSCFTFIIFKPKPLRKTKYTITLSNLFAYSQCDFGLECELKLISPSSTPITSDTLPKITLPVGNSSVVNVNVNHTTTCYSTDTTYYHCNPSDPGGDQAQDFMMIGFRLESAKDDPSDNYDFLANRINMDVEITAEEEPDTSGGPPVSPNSSRYEYGTLESIAALQENKDPTSAISTHIFDGKAPALEFGDITIVYDLLYPKIPASVSDYNTDYDPITLHQFKFTEFPNIFLEEQTGTGQPTKWIEAVRSKGRSCTFETYRLTCTEDEFKNYKLVVYYRTVAGDVAFKASLDKVGASLWFVNSKYLGT